MSLSAHFPHSTQAILSAQRTPPKRKCAFPNDDSIIIISSSPEQNLTSLERVLSTDDEEYFGPQKTRTSPPPPKPRRTATLPDENSIEVLEDEDFARLISDFKYKDAGKTIPFNDAGSTPLTERTGTRKTSLEAFFQECKPTKPTKPKQSRVKTTLTTRVSIPVKPKPKAPKKTSPKPTTPTIDPSTSFFTTWAAAQAPTTRNANSKSSKVTKPRRKPVKKSSVEVILLSPRTGQSSVRRDVGEVARGRLGEKTFGGGMWDACKRGLEGELYDCDGLVVFSQELRRERSPETPVEEI